ncbi:MAG: endonuclease [Alphaproteobacteria bacterium]|nr:endonuclease [Alphaproteobacteria bacterium]
MRIATYNVEWFSALFNRNDKLLLDDKWSVRYKITRARQIEAIAKVLSVIDADAVLIVEAPNTSKRQSSTRALEHFAKVFDLRTRRALEGFANQTRQEITLLYDPDACHARHDPIGGPPNRSDPFDAPRFDTSFLFDLDDDTRPETVTFSKPPLEVALTPKGGKPLRLIGVHVKSKAPHGAKSVEEQVKTSIENRRKQLAQCRWLRRRIDGHLDAREPVIVLGDMNDGPGLDEYELLFGQSSVEVVMGLDNNDDRMLFDPNVAEALALRGGNPPATSRFYIKPRRTFLNALLDYIMVSPDLLDAAKGWTIWHPFDNPDCYNDVELREALLTASDHFPVTLDIDL